MDDDPYSLADATMVDSPDGSEDDQDDDALSAYFASTRAATSPQKSDPCCGILKCQYIAILEMEKSKQ